MADSALGMETECNLHVINDMHRYRELQKPGRGPRAALAVSYHFELLKVPSWKSLGAHVV